MIPLSAAGHASDGQIRELAGEILGRWEYARWLAEWSELTFLKRILEFLDRWLSWMDGLWQTDPLLYWVILCGLFFVSIALILHIVWTLRIALRVQAPPASEAAPEPRPVFAQEAESLAREGRFTEAAHRLQLACISILLECGALELDRSDPNRTLRARLRVALLSDDQRNEILSLVDRLERLWFRDRTEDRDLYADWQRFHGRLRMESGLAP